MRRLAVVALFALACTGKDVHDTDTGTADTDTDTDTHDTDDTDDTDVHYTYPPSAIVLPEVTLVDADGARGPATVVLAGPRIHAVLTDAPTPPADATVLDTAGRWLAPGLVDPHVHLFGSGGTAGQPIDLALNLRASLRFGITSVVDAGSPSQALDLRNRLRAGDLIGPDLKVLGPMVTVPLSHPCEVWNDRTRCSFATDPVVAAALGQHRVDAGYDGIKVAVADAAFTPWPTPRFEGDALRAAVAPVAANDALTYAHVDTWADAVEALDAGATTLAHSPFGGALSADQARDLLAANSIHTTLGAHEGLLEVLAGDVPLSDLRGLVPDAILYRWAELARDPSQVDATWVAEHRTWSNTARAHLTTLRAEGAPLHPASDAGYGYLPHGWSLHRELQRLQDLGWSNQELLAAVTAGNAAAVGWTDRGRIATDQRADLLVLESDPLADLSVLANASTVILAGRPWSATTLGTLETNPSPSPQDPGAFCIDDRDCSGLCDGTTFTCAPTCAVPWSVDNPCGPYAWCIPATSDPTRGLCHTEPQACDLYAPSTCTPAAYGELCLPGDRDTSYCWPAGPKSEGQTCDFTPAGGCQQGLSCSVIDSVCYRLCDPDDTGSTCPSGTCVMQRVAGEDWYGLCL